MKKNQLATQGGKSVVSKNKGPLPTDEHGELVPGEYKMKTGTLKVKKIVPAQHNDVLNVARAMNDDFPAQLKTLFDPEREACLKAIETGLYLCWRPVDKPWDAQDCQRINDKSRCFCNHNLVDHDPYTGNEVMLKCQQSGCVCKGFNWVPSRPEEVGEFWLMKRRDFVLADWRMRCRCKHTHGEHKAHPPPHKCTVSGCSCSTFHSASVCAACDMHWHRHQTVFETERERMKAGRPVREDWLPFSELPKLCEMAMTGKDTGVQTLRDAVPDHLRHKLPSNPNDPVQFNRPSAAPMGARGPINELPFDPRSIGGSHPMPPSVKQQDAQMRRQQQSGPKTNSGFRPVFD